MEEALKNRVIEAHKRTAPFFKSIRDNYSLKIDYPFKYCCQSGKFMTNAINSSVEEILCAGRGKARAEGFSVAVLGRLPPIMKEIYKIKTELHLALRILDRNTERSNRVPIPKHDGSGNVRPITVSHDDNAFINGIVQRSFQNQIARFLPDNLLSFQKGKSCGNATIVDCVIKELALEDGGFYLAVISEDMQKMFDRVPIELQALTLINAGASHGYITWQLANMDKRTNNLVTDLFEETINYECGLPQGVGFSVELSNLYTLLFLQWCGGDHPFPVQAFGNRKELSSLGYVDDTQRYIYIEKEGANPEDIIRKTQECLDRSADLSMMLKMGRNAIKSGATIYNVNNNTDVPDFNSTAWCFDHGGIMQANIKATVVRNNRHALDDEEHKRILEYTKYLGVSRDALQDNTKEIERMKRSLLNRVHMITKRMSTTEEVMKTHNMLVTSVATYSPLCIHFSLATCSEIDMEFLLTYSTTLGYCKTSDAKHAIFLGKHLGGNGLNSFTKEYISAVIREVEVMMNERHSLHGLALEASLIQMRKRKAIQLKNQDRIPENCFLWNEIQHFKSRETQEVLTDAPSQLENHDHLHVKFKHKNLMANNIQQLAKLGIFLRCMKTELSSRITDELLQTEKRYKVLGDSDIKGREDQGATLEQGINGDGVTEFSAIGNIQILIECAIDMARIKAVQEGPQTTFRNIVTSGKFYKAINILPKEVSAKRLADAAKTAIEKMDTDYNNNN